MSQYDGARLLARQVLDILCYTFANAAETFDSTHFAALDGHSATGGFRAFGDHDNCMLPRAGCCRPQLVRHPADVERNFGNEDSVRLAGNARVQGDPTRVPAHNFDNDNPT